MISRALALIGAVAVLLATPLAVTGNWGADPATSYWCSSTDVRSECSADDSDHFVWFQGDVPTSVRTALLDSMSEDYILYNYTYHFYEFFTGEVEVKENSDVAVKWDNYSNSLPFAYTICQDDPTFGASGWNRWCKRQNIWLDASDSCFSSDACRNWVACHELGHTTGLQHTGRVSCMNVSDITGPTDLQGHDREHLADCYPHSAGYYLTSACATYESNW
jgi:hypothetical protein